MDRNSLSKIYFVKNRKLLIGKKIQIKVSLGNGISFNY